MSLKADVSALDDWGRSALLYAAMLPQDCLCPSMVHVGGIQIPKKYKINTKKLGFDVLQTRCRNEYEMKRKYEKDALSNGQYNTKRSAFFQQLLSRFYSLGR